MKVIFVTQDGEEESFDVQEGMTILDVARMYNIDIEGACEGSLVCSTCHVVIDESQYKALCESQPISDSEADMLDLAPYLTSTSRLGCQIKVVDGLRIKLPKGTRNIRIAGKV